VTHAFPEMESTNQITRLRRRVATQINNAVARDLSAILCGLRSSPECKSEAHTSLALAAAEQGLSMARLLVQQLTFPQKAAQPTPPVNLALTLKTALEHVLARGSISLSFHSETLICLPASTSDEILHIAREFATNTVKHAAALTVHCSLSAESDSLVIRIKDDGVGFDPHASVKGFGLLGATERARSIGATLRIDSRSGEGVEVTLRYPIPTVVYVDRQIRL
jgi:signal transduction histidine kinase